jgi:acetyl esterase/lipase
MLARLGPPNPAIEQYELQIPVRDAWTSRSVICRPTHTAPGPLIILYHGGGFITGCPEGMLNYARRLSQLLDAVIVCPSYRLAPEHPFPTAVNDAWDVLLWLTGNATSIGADPKLGFIVGGNSAGANIAGVLARRSVEEKLVPKLTGQFLSFPVFANDPEDEAVQMMPEAEKYRDIWGVSWIQNAEAMFVSREGARNLLGHYKPEFGAKLYNPLSETPRFELSGMPKAFVQVAGRDLLRDDGIVYAYALEDAGVEVRLEAYRGVPHTFPSFLPQLEISRRAAVDVALWFAWLLEREVEVEVVRKAMLDG